LLADSEKFPQISGYLPSRKLNEIAHGFDDKNIKRIIICQRQNRFEIETAHPFKWHLTAVTFGLITSG